LSRANRGVHQGPRRQPCLCLSSWTDNSTSWNLIEGSKAPSLPNSFWPHTEADRNVESYKGIYLFLCSLCKSTWKPSLSYSLRVCVSKICACCAVLTLRLAQAFDRPLSMVAKPLYHRSCNVRNGYIASSHRIRKGNDLCCRFRHALLHSVSVSVGKSSQDAAARTGFVTGEVRQIAHHYLCRRWNLNVEDR